MKVIIGSSSDRKIKTVERIFNAITKTEVNVVGYSTKSGVPETPYDKQTYDGAKNRALSCKMKQIADYYIGLESGLVERYGQFYEEAWACVITTNGDEFYGYSSGLKLPDFILKKMKDSNKEHFEIMATIETEMEKTANDTWGTYTAGAISREISLEEALRNALIQAIPHKESLYLKR